MVTTVRLEELDTRVPPWAPLVGVFFCRQELSAYVLPLMYLQLVCKIHYPRHFNDYDYATQRADEGADNERYKKGQSVRTLGYAAGYMSSNTTKTLASNVKGGQTLPCTLCLVWGAQHYPCLPSGYSCLSIQLQ